METEEYVKGLREFADWVEANGEAAGLRMDDLGAAKVYCFGAEKLTQFQNAVRLLGKGTKEPDEFYYKIKRQFGPVAVMVYTNREAVCTKVTRMETREIEVTEWECEPSILALTDSEVPA